MSTVVIVPLDTPRDEWVSEHRLGAFEFVPSIPREEKRALIEAFELGKVIEWRGSSTIQNVYPPWYQWDYRDLAGEKQPELGHATYVDQQIEWRVPEQEQVTVKYKIAVVGADGRSPYAIAYTEEKYLPKFHDILLDKDDTEHSTTFWRVKLWK